MARMENNIVPTIAPEEIHYVSKTIFSIARYYGGCQAYGHHYYVYDPIRDVLVREDVLKAKAKEAKAKTREEKVREKEKQEKLL